MKALQPSLSNHVNFSTYCIYYICVCVYTLVQLRDARKARFNLIDGFASRERRVGKSTLGLNLFLPTDWRVSSSRLALLAREPRRIVSLRYIPLAECSRESASERLTVIASAVNGKAWRNDGTSCPALLDRGLGSRSPFLKGTPRPLLLSNSSSVPFPLAGLLSLTPI